MESGAVLHDEQFLPAALKLVLNAKKRIYISTFKAEFITKPRGRRLKELFDTLVDYADLGLDIRLLISKRENYGHIPITNLHAVRYLKDNKVKVRHPRNGQLCHAKLILVDDYAAILGSHNLSVRSCNSNFEISYRLNDIYVVAHLYKIYGDVWNNAKGG